jgi:hypothetical protein
MVIDFVSKAEEKQRENLKLLPLPIQHSTRYEFIIHAMGISKSQ